MKESHKFKVNEICDFLENKGYRCKKEFLIFRQDANRFSQIDFCCFHHEKKPICGEIETNEQILSNSKDLEQVNKVLGARTLHATTNLKVDDLGKELKK